jgi:hypothetical protein
MMTKSKKKGKYTHTHIQNYHGNDVLHRGEKTELYGCVQREEKKKRKKRN